MVKGFIFPVQYIRPAGKDAIRIGISQPPIDRIPYHAGQYITLKVEIEGKTYFRSYSLSSTPRLDTHLEIGVKRLPGGIVSTYLHDHLQEGDRLEFMRPAGRFYMETSTQTREHIVLIGGGSGITPLMSILRAVLYQAPYSRVSLLYQNRDQASIMFAEEIDALKDRFSHRFNVRYMLSRPAVSLKADMQEGRLNAALVKGWLDELPRDEALSRKYFLCGPLGLMDAARNGLLNSGVGEGQIFQEKFVADESITRRQAEWKGPSRVVTLKMGEQIGKIKVSPGSTILEAGLQQGMELPYSCKRGICSACMSRLKSGEVKMDDPEALLPFEIENGRVLLCQAHPMTDDVEVEVGF
ncbi:MAG: ferredoxin--NADP reductase [Bacteroidota bacterium]